MVRGWDITEQSGAPAVTTYPEWTHKFSAYYSAGTNTKHIVFQNIDDHLHDIFWVPGVKPTHTILHIHNQELAAVNVPVPIPPLTWSNSLAAGAQTWKILETDGQQGRLYHLFIGMSKTKISFQM